MVRFFQLGKKQKVFPESGFRLVWTQADIKSLFHFSQNSLKANKIFHYLPSIFSFLSNQKVHQWYKNW